MNRQSQVYLRQLMSRLLYSGVDGSDVGELVAEVAQHLEDSGADPVSEFGPVSRFAEGLIAQRRIRRRTWVRRAVVPWVGGVCFLIGAFALVGRSVEGSVLISGADAVRIATVFTAVMIGLQVMVRYQRGDRPFPPLIGLVVVVVVMVAGIGIGQLLDPDLGVALSGPARWAVVVIGLSLTALSLGISWNPVRFPDHFDTKSLGQITGLRRG